MLEWIATMTNDHTIALGGRSHRVQSRLVEKRHKAWLGRSIIFAAVFLGVSVGEPAHAQNGLDPAAQRGLVFARTNCSRCHSVDKVSPSPLPIAPPFRTLHLRYPVETLQEALAEGIVTGHPTMPEFRLDPGQIGDLISFMKSLER
jgi:mono/diheme cytochrome c family protein